MPRVLLVTYDFPPQGGVSVLRSLKLVKYLPGLGWDVTVLTVADPLGHRLDPDLERQVPPQVTLIRAWSLEPERILQWWLRRRERPARSGGGRGVESRGGDGMPQTPDVATNVRPSGTLRRLYWALRASWLPDDKRFWVSRAVEEALRDSEARPPTVVVSSGPPHTAHLVGSRVAHRLGIPHVVDLRDPWVGNPQRRSPLPFHDRLAARQEARVFGEIAAAVTTAASVTREVAERYPNLRRVVTIHNGFDSDDLHPSGDRPAPANPRMMRMVYTGTFYGNHHPQGFLAGLARAKEREPRLAERLEVVFVGSEIDELARSHGVSDLVRSLGFLPHREALAELSAADAALVILQSVGWDRCIPSKVFEYIGWQKPILMVAGRGDLSDLLSGVAGTTMADPDDPEDIATGLLEMVQSWETGRLSRPTDEQAQQFSRAKVAERFSRLLTEVVRDHARRAAGLAGGSYEGRSARLP